MHIVGHFLVEKCVNLTSIINHPEIVSPMARSTWNVLLSALMLLQLLIAQVSTLSKVVKLSLNISLLHDIVILV